MTANGKLRFSVNNFARSVPSSNSPLLWTTGLAGFEVLSSNQVCGGQSKDLLELLYGLVEPLQFVERDSEIQPCFDKVWPQSNCFCKMLDRL